MQHFISQYGYLAVFVLMLAESACIPIPSEVIMMFGGALASGAVAGAHPALIGVVAAGVAGNVAGSYIAWAVGKYAGLPVIHRWGRWIGIREHEINRATAWFERYGPVAVLIGRVMPVVRTFISLPAGIAEMPAGRFGLYTTLGCIPWTAALGIVGYAVGANWEQVANAFHGPTYVIAGVLVIGAVAGIVVYRRRRKAAEANGTGPAPTGSRRSGDERPPARSEYAGQPSGDWGSAGQSPGDWRSGGHSPGDWGSAGQSPGDWGSAGQPPRDRGSAGQPPRDWGSAGQSPRDWRSTGQPPGDWRSAGQPPASTGNPWPGSADHPAGQQWRPSDRPQW